MKETGRSERVRLRGARGREEERKRGRKIICQLQVDFSFDVE